MSDIEWHIYPLQHTRVERCPGRLFTGFTQKGSPGVERNGKGV